MAEKLKQSRNRTPASVAIQPAIPLRVISMRELEVGECLQWRRRCPWLVLPVRGATCKFRAMKRERPKRRKSHVCRAMDHDIARSSIAGRGLSKKDPALCAGNCRRLPGYSPARNRRRSWTLATTWNWLNRGGEFTMFVTPLLSWPSPMNSSMRPVVRQATRN